MQEHFNENYMESDKFPKAEFKGRTDLSGVNFTKDGSYKVKASGKLTMHGVTKDVTTPGTIVVKSRCGNGKYQIYHQPGRLWDQDPIGSLFQNFE